MGIYALKPASPVEQAVNADPTSSLGRAPETTAPATFNTTLQNPPAIFQGKLLFTYQGQNNGNSNDHTQDKAQKTLPLAQFPPVTAT